MMMVVSENLVLVESIMGVGSGFSAFFEYSGEFEIISSLQLNL